jgi:hypothetical protein
MTNRIIDTNAPLEYSIRIWLCDCQMIHVETNHCRRSFSPAEFVDLLRQNLRNHQLKIQHQEPLSSASHT